MTSIVAISGIVAGCISFIGYFPGIITTIYGQSRPQRVGWFIWLVLSILLFLSYHSSGASESIWVPFGDMVGIGITFIIALRYGEKNWKWSLLDKWCLVVAGLSIVMWAVFRSAGIALLFNLAADIAGALPTIKQAYYNPHKENSLTWGLFLVANSLNLLAIGNWGDWHIVAYPITMIIITAPIACLVFWPRKQKNSVASLLPKNKCVDK